MLNGLIAEWSNSVVSVPDKLPLDGDMQARARTLSGEVGPALNAAGRRWLEEIRAASPQVSDLALSRPLMARLNNELVSWLVSSPGAAREDIEWRLAQKPSFCRERAELHQGQWAFLVERLLLLQPLQDSERESAIAAERQRLKLWLAGGLVEGSGPTPPPQLQAFQAAERQRAGEPVYAQAMVPWLSRQILGERAPLPYAGLMQECALMQWWLANEVQRRSLSPQEAMRLFRHGTLPANENLLLMPGAVRQRSRTAAIDEYPPIAQSYEVTGTTQFAVVLDAAGRVRDMQVTQRRLEMPGLAAGQVPLAFEQTLDRATFARVRAMRFDKPDADKLREGVVRQEMEFVWKLN